MEGVFLLLGCDLIWAILPHMGHVATCGCRGAPPVPWNVPYALLCPPFLACHAPAGMRRQGACSQGALKLTSRTMRACARQPEDAHTLVEQYRIEVSTCSAFNSSCIIYVQNISTGFSSWEISDVDMGELYFIRVAAENTAGLSAWNTVSQSFAMEAENLAAVQYWNGQGSRLDITWTHTITDPAGARYHLEIASNDRHTATSQLYPFGESCDGPRGNVWAGGMNGSGIGSGSGSEEHFGCKLSVRWDLPANVTEPEMVTVTIVYENARQALGLPTEYHLALIRPPSDAENLEVREQTNTNWVVGWTSPAFFWSTIVGPLTVRTELRCSSSQATIVMRLNSSSDPLTLVKTEEEYRVEWTTTNGKRIARVSYPFMSREIQSGVSYLECQEGEDVLFSLRAANRLLRAANQLAFSTVDFTFRALAPPAKVNRLVAQEVIGSMERYIAVTWDPPNTTGLLAYRIEWSDCGSFDALVCIYGQHVLRGNQSHFNLTKDDLQRTNSFFFIRVAARNSVGWGMMDRVRQRYMILPKIMSPAAPVWVESANAHIWVAGSDPILDGVLEVRVSGLDVRDAAGLDARISFDDEPQDKSVSISNFTHLDEGLISVLLTLPSKPCFQPVTCTGIVSGRCVCHGRIHFASKTQLADMAVVHLQYFNYPKSELVSALPSGGPETGGTSVRLLVRDFTGDKTRNGAGLLSAVDASKVCTSSTGSCVSVRVRLSCSNNSTTEWSLAEVSSNVETIGVGTTQAVLYPLLLDMPLSPCGPERAEFEWQLCTGEDCSDVLASAVSFKYRAPGIVDVTPRSGIINRGNTPVFIIADLEDVDANYRDINVTLRGTACDVISVTATQVGESQLLRVRVKAPQFPREEAGELLLKIRIDGQDFDHPWQYLSPPSPQIIPGSIRIDGEFRDPPWFKMGDIPEVELQISNLDKKFDTAFDNFRVAIAQSQLKQEQIIRSDQITKVASNVRLHFEVDNAAGFAEGTYNISVHVMRDGIVKHVLEFLSGIEIRDMSVASLIPGAVAPTEGLVTGGTLVLMALSGATSMLDANAALRFTLGGVNGSMSAVMELSEWKSEDSPKFMELIQDTGFLNRGSTQLVGQYENVVDKARQLDSAGVAGLILIIVRTPDLSSLDLKSKHKVNAAIHAGDSHELITFRFHLQRPAMSAEEAVTATTASGAAMGAMSGNFPIKIELPGSFPITYAVDDLLIEFGGVAATISKLDKSNSGGTTVRANVPAVLSAGIVEVRVVNENFPDHPATFKFEYIDDTAPELLDVLPFVVYADVITEIRAVVTNIPAGITKDEVEIRILEKESGAQIDSMQQPKDVGMPDAKNPSTRDIVFESIPLGDVDVDVEVEVRIQIRGKGLFFYLQYLRPPSGAPVIESMLPDSGFCTDGSTKLTMRITNVRESVANSLHVEFGGHVVPRDDVDVVYSSMSEIRISFPLPMLSDSLIGGQRLLVRTEESSTTAEKAFFECLDSRQAERLYVIPNKAYAEQNTTVVIGIRNFNAQSAFHFM